MAFKKPWELESKKKKGSYLKYEEGEVIPVEPKQSHYPPFLNDEENVKQFKEIQQEEARRHAKKMMVNLKKSKVQESDNPSPYSSSSSPSASSSSPSSPSSSSTELRPPKRPLNRSLIMKVIWLVIIGGLVYYSIPMVKYFSSETPNLSGITGTVDKAKGTVDQAKETVQKSSTEVKQVTGTVTDTAQKTANKVADGAGLVDAAKQNLGSFPTPSQNSTVAQLSGDQWLSVITSIQNQKQGNLILLSQYTNALAKGEISQSQYRLEVKGVVQKVERLSTQFEESIQGQNLSQTGNVVNALKTELDQLEKMSISLSSSSESSVIQVFNQEVPTQNALTEQYKTSLKSLLNLYGKNYKEVDGKIVY